MTNSPNNFPRIQQPFVDRGGSITEPWLRLLQSIWNRTGGPAGSNIVDTNDSIVGLENAVDSLQGAVTGLADSISSLGDSIADIEDSISGVTDTAVLGAYGVLDEDYLRPQPLIQHPGYTSGAFYAAWPGDVTVVDVVPAVDRIFLFPFYVASTVSTLDWFVNLVLRPGACSVKFGLWANRFGRPVGPPIVSSAVTPAGVGVATFTSTAVILGPGWYWAGTKFTGTLPTCVGAGNSGLLASFLMGTSLASTTLGNASQAAGLYFNDAYANSMPNLTGQTLVAAVSSVPAVGFKTAP